MKLDHILWTDLNTFVAVGTVVDYWQRLLEARTSNPNNICYQLTDSNHHLKEKTDEKPSNIVRLIWRVSFKIHNRTSVPVSVSWQRTCGPCSQSYSSWGSRVDGPHHCEWHSAWSYSILKSHSRTRRTCQRGLRKTCRETEGRGRSRDRDTTSDVAKGLRPWQRERRLWGEVLQTL